MSQAPLTLKAPRRLGAPPIDISHSLIDIFQITKDAAEMLDEVPYVKALCGVVVQILQIREEVKKNKETARELIDAVQKRSQSLFNVLGRYAEDESKLQRPHLEKTLEPLKTNLGQYQVLLEDICSSMEQLKVSKGSLIQGFRRTAIKDQLESLQHRLTVFDMTFLVEQVFHLRMDLVAIAGSITVANPQTIREKVLMTPPPPTHFFIGRADILAHMKAIFFPTDATTTLRQKRYILYGLGGSGKTQLALKFINDHIGRFSTVYMVDASSVERIKACLEEIGSEAEIPSSSGSPHPNDTLRWLSRLKEDWLILFDNADDPEIDLRQFFPPCTHGNIIITTRNPECSTHSSPQDASKRISDLDLGDAISLLFSSSRRTGRDDQETATVLVQEVGCLPLAVVQAGSYIFRMPGLSFQAYIDRYRTNREKLLGMGSKQDSYAHSVNTTWEISFAKLSSVAQSFLQLCGFLHNEGITADIFRQAILNKVADESPEQGYHTPGSEYLDVFRTPDGDFDAVKFDTVIMELMSYSLIQMTTFPNLTIHSLVHAWSRDRLTSEERRSFQRIALSILSLSITSDKDGSSYAHRRLLLPHMDAALPDPISEVEVGLAQRFAQAYELEGKWKQMQSLCSFIAAHWEALLGPTDPETLRTRRLLARALWGQGRYREAEEIQVDLVEKWTSTMGPEHEETIRSMVNLASTYHFQGRNQETESLTLKILKFRKQVLGSEHPETLTSMSHLASTYRKQGRYSEAESLDVEVLRLRKQVLGLEHPDTLVSMANLASTYREQGRYPETLALDTEVLERQTRLLGAEHPDTLRSMANLASTYQAQGRYDDAKPLETEVLQLRRRILGSEHPDTARSMVNLAFACQMQGEYETAEALNLEGYNTYLRELGPSNPNTIWSLQRLDRLREEHGPRLVRK